MKKVRFYKSENIIRDLGIIWFYQFLKSNGFEANIYRNYLEFNYLDSKKISKLITEKVLFDIFKNGNKKELVDIKNPEKSIFTIEEYENLTFDNFIIEITEKFKFSEKKLAGFKKNYDNIRIPYMRNSSKYGLNGKDNSFKKMQSNIEKLINIIQGYSDERNDLSEFEVRDSICEVCNINKTTKLDYNLEKRKDSKYIFTFKGAEKSGFKNNGSENESQICFECEFLNLCALFYVNLKRPKNIIRMNNLIDMNILNKILEVHKNNFGDREVLRYLGKLREKDILIYKTTIDSKKGIILNLSKSLEIENVIREIKLVDLIKNMAINRESALRKERAKHLIDNKNMISLDRWFLNNVGQKDGTNGKINSFSTSENLNQYNQFLELGGMNLEKIVSLQIIGKELSKRMSGAEKSKFFYSINRYLKIKNRYDLERIIIEKIKKYKLEGDLNTEKIDELFGSAEYDQVKRNMNLFLMEVIKERKEVSKDA